MKSIQLDDRQTHENNDNDKDIELIDHVTEQLVTMDDWEAWAPHYKWLPYIMKYDLQEIRVDSWSRLWEQSSDNAFVLESGKAGQYTFFGRSTFSTIKGKGLKAEVVGNIQNTDHEQWHGNPLELVKRWMKPYHTPRVRHAPKFVGGCVGYWGYDVIRTIEKLPEVAIDDLPHPDYYFMMVNELWIIDHSNKHLYCSIHVPIEGNQELCSRFEQASTQTKQMKRIWDDIAKQKEDTNGLDHSGLHIDIEQIATMESSFPKSKYMEAVERIREYIRAGDVFQVNLSLRQTRPMLGRSNQAQGVYEWLRRINPSPYMAYLQFPGLQIVSASPELLVKLEDGLVSTRPIAGTRPRGQNEAEDERLRNELLCNEKERAEHIMLVDLERNDLGRVCKYGTVKVDDFMVTEFYSHVMHIVSEVKGEIAAGKDAFDCLASVFPGGTITGAPKIRTMEIIEELEPVRRGAYTGSIGWIDYNGNMEFNIIIRTLVVCEGMGYVQAGAGIVIDSDPEREYVESLNKAKAIWKAIELSEMSLDRRRDSL